jgi:hypothetical protein
MGLLLGPTVIPINPGGFSAWSTDIGGCSLHEFVLLMWKDFLLHHTTTHSNIRIIQREGSVSWCCILRDVLSLIRRNLLLHYTTTII